VIFSERACIFEQNKDYWSSALRVIAVRLRLGRGKSGHHRAACLLKGRDWWFKPSGRKVPQKIYRLLAGKGEMVG